MSEYRKTEPPVSRSLEELKRWLSMEMAKLEKAIRDIEQRLKAAGI